MPGTHIALIRGINVGRNHRVSMTDLRQVFESVGYTDVHTILNSGNVVFHAGRASSTNIAASAEKEFTHRAGFSARIVVLTRAELLEVMESNPLLPSMSDPARLLVHILNRPEDRTRLLPLSDTDWAPDLLALGKRAAYLWCPEGMLASRLGAAVGKLLGEHTTVRNWATLNKIYAHIQKP